MHVVVAAVPVEGLPPGALVPEAGPLVDVDGTLVEVEHVQQDAVEAQLAEGEVEQDVHGLRAVALVPLARLADADALGSDAHACIVHERQHRLEALTLLADQVAHALFEVDRRRLRNRRASRRRPVCVRPPLPNVAVRFSALRSGPSRRRAAARRRPRTPAGRPGAGRRAEPHALGRAVGVAVYARFLLQQVQLVEYLQLGDFLGADFGQHLLHLVDVAAIDPDHPLKDFETVNRELHQYSQALAQKPQIVVLNKMDVDWAEDAATLFKEAYGKGDLLQISAATGKGLDKLTAAMCNLLDQLDEAPSEKTD